ncbi:hypothetical protein L1987_10837 [Smallanthus sonchifolius]|uniref:Uncharacterized protein n=1 Tax=Smallanthus sonchifolius TaxID=185202 RepID=A0ACB9J9U1_9ASTR|nr:hypothetical protein L1987_10837 [Smallanthus sonchifolius]
MMNPYHLQTMQQQQQQNYVYGFRVTPLPSPWIGHEVIPVRYTMGTFYPRSGEYVDDVAILNIPNTMRVNQEPMQITYVHRRPALMNPFEAFLEGRLIRHELEADAAAQQLTAGTSGLGLSEEKISKHLHVYTAQEEVDSCCLLH